MAAASNKPGAVHYALIVFVMMSVILGITTYMFHREYSDRAAKIFEVEENAKKQTQTIKKQDDEIQALKNQTGNKGFEITLDPANPDNATSVIGASKSDMSKFGKDLAGTTYQQTLQKLREAIDAMSADVSSKTAAIAALQKDLNDQRTRLNTQVDTHRKAQEKAEADLRNLVAKRDEMLNSKQTEIDRFKADVNQLTGELAQEKEGREKQVKGLQKELAQLETRIEILQDKNNVLSGERFEQADGLIAAVSTSKTVVIDLGEADQLKKGMTFSVYPKDNRALGAELDELKANVDQAYRDQKIGVGERDDRKQVLNFTGLKGKIAVTRLLGSHSAEAQIIEEDLYRPMVRGDVIYTPIWSPGLVEKISVIGDLDLDGDGKSDREQFHQLMTASGVVIDNEIDDAGQRIPAEGKITVQTKFLVLGNIPDRADIVVENEKARIDKILSHQKDMSKEARANGVRVVKLNDFLAHIGFQAKRRMFRPGDNVPYLLKDGLKPPVNAPLGDNSTSKDIFRPRSVPQQQSTGTTSKLFGTK